MRAYGPKRNQPTSVPTVVLLATSGAIESGRGAGGKDFRADRALHVAFGGAKFVCCGQGGVWIETGCRWFCIGAVPAAAFFASLWRRVVWGFGLAPAQPDERLQAGEGVGNSAPVLVAELGGWEALAGSWS
jgi:hypothetical protein